MTNSNVLVYEVEDKVQIYQIDSNRKQNPLQFVKTID